MNARATTIVRSLLVIALSCLFLGCTSITTTSGVKNFTSSSPTPSVQTTVSSEPTPQVTKKLDIIPPFVDAKSRITKKPFGIKVSPQNSPVQPERFSGYHTGVDFETFADEQDKDISIAAICTGKILQERTASGYGGILVQACQLDNQPVTVVYGHLKLTSIQQSVGDSLSAGESFALLGNAFSTETAGERKHLHLGIKKGDQVDVRGYVQNVSDLQGWIDFVQYL